MSVLEIIIYSFLAAGVLAYTTYVIVKAVKIKHGTWKPRKRKGKDNKEREEEDD